MSIQKITAGDLFIADSDLPHAKQICKEDTVSAISQYEAFRVSKLQGEVSSGMLCKQSFFWLAVAHHNESLVKYFTDHMDHPLLSLPSDSGYTALFYLDAENRPIEKVLKIAQILIDAKINLNRCSTFRGKLHQGDTVLGSCIRSLYLSEQPYSHTPLTPEQKKKTSALAQLYLKNGGEFFVRELNDQESESNKKMVGRCTRLLQEVSTHAYWPSVRLLFLGKESAKSPLFSFPQELIFLVIEKVTFSAT